MLVGCATAPKESPKPAAVAAPAPAPSAKDITLDEINAAIEKGEKFQNEKGEEVVCRREAKVGSRLARETICMTRAEWLRVSEQSQLATKKSMRLGKIPQGT